MSLTPYVTDLATGTRTDESTEVYDFSTKGRRGLLLVLDVTAVGSGQSFVTGAAPTLPAVVVGATNDTFKFNGDEFTIAPGSYATIAALATAIGAALHTATAFSSLVTVAADPAQPTKLRFTSVATGVHAEAFAVGTTDALVSVLGLTDGWTIAHTQAAAASDTATVTVSGKDESSGKFYTILTSAGLAGVGTLVLQVHPAMTAAANLVANALLPANVRVSVAHTSDDAVTRTLGLQLVA